MIAMISGFISKGISRSRNIAITMISASGEIIGLGYTTKSLTLQACFVLGFLLQTSLAYRLDPNPQTNSIFATVPSSSISSSTSSQSSSQLSSKHGVKVFYQSGNSEASLPVCSPNSVCNKVDTYGSPWVEKQCRCPSSMDSCSSATHSKDGHTISDRNRQYKVCEPVKTLRKCKYFRDVTWTYIMYPDNTTQQVMHCRCPHNSVAYLIKRHAYQSVSGTGYQYSFACSPQTKLKCQRKEPCRLFSVRKNYERPTADEVNTSQLCECPHRKKCPKHHLDVGVIPGKIYSDDSMRTYSAYCM
jgi:giant-lens protein precursor (argos protein)